jgi:hypothetical protein
MEIESIILTACITVFSLGMFLVSALSYRKFRNKKLIFVSVAFFVFFLKGVIQSIGLFSAALEFLNTDVNMKVFDLIILLFLFIATLKR